MYLTIFETEDDRLSCLYSWDSDHVDRQGIAKVHKLEVESEVIETIRNYTLGRLEEVLRGVINPKQHVD